MLDKPKLKKYLNTALAKSSVGISLSNLRGVITLALCWFFIA